MNQDFTVKKSNICLKKKFVQGVSPGKKNSCTSSARKKKFVQACFLRYVFVPLFLSLQNFSYVLLFPLEEPQNCTS